MYETIHMRITLTIPLEVASRAVLDGVSNALVDAGYRVREVVFVEAVEAFPGLYGVTLNPDTAGPEVGEGDTRGTRPSNGKAMPTGNWVVL